MTTANRSFRSADRLGSIVISFLVVDVVAAVLGIVTTRRELHLLERFIRGEQDVIDEVFEAIHRSTLFARIGLIAFAATAVSWCLWQHRSHANLHALEVPELEYWPGWAIAWWFVPIANIWRPFEAMRELWKASGGDPRWWATRTRRLLGWWWATWLIGGFAGRLLLVATRQVPPALGPLVTADRVLMVGDAATVVAGVLAIALVRSIVARQAALRRSDVALPPPPAHRPPLPGAGVP